ncbi:carbon-nitrogen hydrolase family protein [Stappia sp. GBMRC 2046]|uniref:Carbon-nitrogen hydrolase family protein n=1 Tax=Stappia sediminis TaxID=2692190 RepID=A0A7X3S9U0_9HYPH|nr:carbon-nitrogen hydrolase family protein [Stappia sediminis]MXN67291.1 carbon-nitrogen hydrolase family protein [Stappia sediminis]
MIPFAIAGVQMHVPAMHDNIAAMVHRVDMVMARFPWVQMIVFSELAMCGPVLHRPAALPGEGEHALQKVAAKHGVWVVTGSMFEKVPDGRVFNTCSVIGPQGEIVTRYRKMFPFRPYEHDVSAGTEFCVFDVPEIGRFGVSICYDIWFPETTRTLTSMGVEVLLHPVLTGTIDRDVELAMARATAAQFQCYVFDINGLGAGGVGRSCVVDPAGTVLYQAAGQEEFIPIEVDLRQVRRQRETGIRGLGQVLKSFRDRAAEFPVYDRASGADSYLYSLGPLAMPQKGSRAGLGDIEKQSSAALNVSEGHTLPAEAEPHALQTFTNKPHLSETISSNFRISEKNSEG